MDSLTQKDDKMNIIFKTHLFIIKHFELRNIQLSTNQSVTLLCLSRMHHLINTDNNYLRFSADN